MFDELTLGDNVSGEDSVIDLDALMRVVTDFARLLVNEYHVSDALHDLVDGVTEVLGLTGAGVSLADGEWIRFATAGSEPIGVLERAQEEAQDGPCVVAHREGREVLVTDLADDPARWPHLSKTAARLGVAAVAGIPMRLDETRLGALNIYRSARHDWIGEEVRVARLLADIATGYVTNASRLDTARHTSEQLQTALESRVVIEQAKGMLAAERKVSMDEAFSLLRNHARRNNVSLRSVADGVVNLRLHI